jgi:purine nucleosidase
VTVAAAGAEHGGSTLDTDIGTDPDDLLALATLIGSPEVDLAAITTVYGDTRLRARIAARALRMAGAPRPAIVPGAEGTLSGRPVWWAGHEGKLFGDLRDEAVDEGEDAAAVLAAAETVFAIGPLTNVAGAVRAGTAGPLRLVLMGGHFGADGTEHNIRSDAAAAQIVFASGIPLSIVGIEQTRRLRLREEFVVALSAASPLGALLAAEVRQFRGGNEEDLGVPHDAVAVVSALRPDLFSFDTGRVEVETAGQAEGRVELVRDPHGPHRVVADFDVERVRHEIESRVLAGVQERA